VERKRIYKYRLVNFEITSNHTILNFLGSYCRGFSLCVPAPPRRRANAASRRACNLDSSRAYIANIYSELRIYPVIEPESAAFPTPRQSHEGEQYHSGGCFAKIRTATIHYGLYLRECGVFARALQRCSACIEHRAAILLRIIGSSGNKNRMCFCRRG